MVQWKAPPQTVVFILMTDNRVRTRERKYNRRSKAQLCVRTIPDARVLLNGSRAMRLPHPLHTQYILLECTWGAVAQRLLGQS
ncbi:MAG TPA: hypothetical protein VGA58_05575 [bacterium]